MFDSKEIGCAQKLLQAILKKKHQDALSESKSLLGEIFGKRFSDEIENNGVLRYKSLIGQEENIQYWGLLYEGATTSGVYENFSLVAFPDNTDSPKQVLLCFGIGTGGITDDASLLGVPGVKRSINSLLKFVRRENWLINGTKIFVKDDLADESTSLPKEVISELGNFSNYDSLWRKYGRYLPSVCVVEKNDGGAKAFLSHILLYGKFREWSFKKKYGEMIENNLFPKLIEVWRGYPEVDKLAAYVPQRKYIILEGPPGTGKTYLAEKIAQKLKEDGIVENYEIIQFHSSITYEDFIEGIKPNTDSDQLVFKENIGPLIRNVEKAKNSQKKGYILKITLTEFDEPKTFPIAQLKDWFSSSKFDRRHPWDCVKKWINSNEKYLGFLGINHSWENEKGLTLKASTKIGLAPIKNPYGGKVYGAITVKPRIGWIKISEILDSIGWKVKPNFLEKEEPIMSDGVLPRWIKAIDTLKAIERALSCHLRGIKETHEIRGNPVGRVNWNNYSIRDVPSGKWNRFDCSVTDYSLDLDIHRQFKGIIEQIEKDLLGRYVPPNVKREASPVLQRATKILESVNSEVPNVDKLKRLSVPSFYRSIYEDTKTRAIEYVSQSKFSIYSAEFFGLPWAIDMAQLFEFWVEFWSYKFSKKIGANFYSNVRGNSQIGFLPLGRWGGLRALKPDIIIDKDDSTMVIDIKYKKHLLYLKLGNFTKDILEEHRHDIHQILAYAGSSSKTDKKAVLVYPKLLSDSTVEMAKVINYQNSNINLTMIKTDTSFDSTELINKLHDLWKNHAVEPII